MCSVAQSCLTLHNPMDCTLPGSSVNGISQARILEWVAIFYPGDLPDPRASGPRESNPRLLHEKENSLPLSHLGSLRTKIHDNIRIKHEKKVNSMNVS